MYKSEQEVFDKVWEHFKSHNFRKCGDSSGCYYRYGKHSCAVGCLIPDSIYNGYMEDKAVDEIYYEYDLNQIFNVELLDFLSDIQDCHDSSSDLKESLINFAIEYNLDIPEGKD